MISYQILNEEVADLDTQDKIPLAGYEISLNDDPTLQTISLTLFVYGCPRRCDGCHNPEFQQLPEDATLWSVDDIITLIKKKTPLVRSICFCGGDFLPFYKKQLMSLLTFCTEANLKTILYTGEEYSNIDTKIKSLCNIIVSGPYQRENKTTFFPASTNQEVWVDNVKINSLNLAINQRGYNASI